MAFEKDPLEVMILKIFTVFVIAIIAIYLLSNALSVFTIMPSTGSVLGDALFFVVIPLCAVFFVIYRIFKVFNV